MDSERLRVRRDAQRRALRRKRRAAVAILATILAVAIVLVVALGSSGSGGAHARESAGALSTASSGARAHASTASSSVPSHGGVATGHPGTATVPILMYHVIAPAPAGAPFPGLYVTPEQFAAQMRALKGAGWTSVTLDELDSYWRRGVSLPRGKPIVISFDNGYQSQFTNALPVLRSLGWVGDENIQLTGLPPSQGGLGENQVRGLIAAGWELDTQGISHADLIALGASALHEQVAVARTTIQRRYRVPVNWFCYPSGHYDATVIAAVKAAGFKGSTTVVPGWASPREDPYRLPRLRVLGGTSPASLLSEIAAIREGPPPPASYNGA
jgi:peptidoglycan/xylan/chitin deacetylase (PgdA/CDA1 family)